MALGPAETTHPWAKTLWTTPALRKCGNTNEQYFERKKYAYFGRLERILKECGASYGGRYDPTRRFSCAAVSRPLDLAQWATKPLWSGLAPETRQTLLDDGVPFFAAIAVFPTLTK